MIFDFVDYQRARRVVHGPAVATPFAGHEEGARSPLYLLLSFATAPTLHLPVKEGQH